MRAVLDLTDAAYYLHTTADAVRDLVKLKKIPYRKRGDKLIFLISDLDGWLKTLPGLDVQEVVQLTAHPATFRQIDTGQTPQHTTGDSGVMTPIALVRGPKGRNRARLQSG